jgi:nucleoside-diphosphate-sugar epimerase
MKILVTGASGRLGSCVCRLLVESGADFVAVDKFPVSKLEYPIEMADLTDVKTCQRIIEGVDALIHFANLSNFNAASPEVLYPANTAMNMNLFQAAANSGCQRIIFASSIQVLDGQLPTMDRKTQENVLTYLPVDSEAPAFPRNVYALSKEAGERMLSYFADVAGMTSIAIRFPLLVDWEFMRELEANNGMERGNAYDLFAYLPVYSAAEACFQAITAQVNGYRNYFVASKDNLEQRPAREIVEQEMADLPCRKPIEEMDSLVDCSKVEAELGWYQPQSLDESLARYEGRESVRPYD